MLKCALTTLEREEVVLPRSHADVEALIAHLVALALEGVAIQQGPKVPAAPGEVAPRQVNLRLPVFRGKVHHDEVAIVVRAPAPGEH